MKLPPMNALRAFEAVSRLGSVSKAAEELCWENEKNILKEVYTQAGLVF